jgi:thiamine-monophosphate kinase
VKKLSDIGERKAIQIIANILSKKGKQVEIGDDCAVLDYGEDFLLVSTDLVTEKSHIVEPMTPWQVGWFAVSINLSDLAAKGGEPLGLVLSVGLPKDTSTSFLKMFIRGAQECADFHDTSIIGGDTKENPTIIICGTIVGRVKKNEFMGRKGAKPGDIVAVTGSLGRAGAGYYALEQGAIDEELLKGLFEPRPRLKEGRALARKRVVSSCMDISDGLSSSIYQLREMNGVGFEIASEQLPLAPALLELSKREKQLDVYKYALHYGGDYELLLTVPPEKFETAVDCIKKTGTRLTAIGRVTSEKDYVCVIKHDSKRILPDEGYEHFRNHTF